MQDEDMFDGDEGAVLAAFHRKIIGELRISPVTYNYMLAIWSRRRVSDSSVVKLHTKGNLKRAMDADTMTFKVFVQALALLGVREVEMSLRLEFGVSQLVTQHKIRFPIGDRNAPVVDGTPIISAPRKEVVIVPAKHTYTLPEKVYEPVDYMEVE